MASPIPLPEQPQDEWDISEWIETLAGIRPGSAQGNAMMQSDSITTRVEGNKVRSCLQQVIGYSYADDGPPYKLYRPSVGIQHPFLPNLWSESYNTEFDSPLANPDDADQKARVLSLQGGYSPEFYSRYANVNVSINFTPMRFRAISDDDPVWAAIDNEYRRFFAQDGVEPSNEFISAEGAGEDSAFKFAERPTDRSEPVIGVNGTPFTGLVLRRKTQTRFKTLWKQVPLNYLVGEYGFNSSNYHNFLLPVPRRLERSLGTVNSAPFPGPNGRPAGTLLLDAVRFVLYQQPVLSDKEIGLWAVDVGMDFVHFDPKRVTDANWTPSPSTTPTADRLRGHHLAPCRNDDRGYWFAITNGLNAGNKAGTYSGGTQLEKTDFNDLFYHVDDPAHPIPD